MSDGIHLAAIAALRAGVIAGAIPAPFSVVSAAASSCA